MDPYDIESPALEMLDDACSFALGAFPSGLAMLPDSAELEVIAGDGAGGCFYLWHAQSRDGRVPVVYLSSYGETSRFAVDFDAALTIVVAFPGYWGDILVSVHKSDLLVAQSLAHYEGQLDDDYRDARDELRDMFGLDLDSAAPMLVEGARTTPAFSPMLDSPEGKIPPGSFANRPYPR